MSEHGTKDALGNEIIIGDYYGYSVDSNGVTTTTVGEALKFTPSGKLSIAVLFSRKGLWMYEAENHSHDAITVSVKPSKLFPISQDVIDDFNKVQIDDVVNESEIKSEKEMLDNNLVIYHNGSVLSVLNENLVKKQKLDQYQIEELKNLHIKMCELKKQMEKTDDVAELHEFAKQVEDLEFAMQKIWNFEENRNFHTHWIRVPKCICPHMDNQDYYGTPFRNINAKCPVHGKI
jgi:hypothetical protein